MHVHIGRLRYLHQYTEDVAFVQLPQVLRICKLITEGDTHESI